MKKIFFLFLAIFCLNFEAAEIFDTAEIPQKTAGDRLSSAEFNKILRILENLFFDNSAEIFGIKKNLRVDGNLHVQQICDENGENCENLANFLKNDAAEKIGKIENFSTEKNYSAGNFVIFEKKIFRAIAEKISAGDFFAAEWEEISAGGGSAVNLDLIDDSAEDGETQKTWSADKIFDTFAELTANKIFDWETQFAADFSIEFVKKTADDLVESETRKFLTAASVDAEKIASGIFGGKILDNSIGAEKLTENISSEKLNLGADENFLTAAEKVKIEKLPEIDDAKIAENKILKVDSSGKLFFATDKFGSGL